MEDKIIVKRQAETNDEYGCRPENRKIKDQIDYGVVVINKPAGPTSHQVAEYVKRILKIDKAGHSGTLDPNVTGVLAIALGRATRVVETLLKSGKEYVALMHLHDKVDEDNIRQAFSEFTGKIMQMPPVKSAVRRRLREREIYYVKILEMEGKDVLFKIGCQAGTYIRKYIHDLAIKLGTRGHMQQLIRTKAGVYTDEQWHSLHDLKDAYEFYLSGDDKHLKKIILPIESVVVNMKKVWILDNAVDAVCHGASLYLAGIAKIDDGIMRGNDVAIMTLKDELVGIGKAVFDSGGMKKHEKGVAVKSNKVFMERGTYPKLLKIV